MRLSNHYLPGIGRCTNADTLIPDPANPQSFNRYAYTLNNPLRFTDPSGHCGADVNNDSSVNEDLLQQCIALRDNFIEQFNIQVDGIWFLAEMQVLIRSLEYFFDWATQHNLGIFLGGITIDRTVKGSEGRYSGCYAIILACEGNATYLQWITIYAGSSENSTSTGQGSLEFTTFHEMAHVYLRYNPHLREQFENSLGWGIYDPNTYSWSKVPSQATDYGETLAELGSLEASVEDFAEQLAFSLTVAHSGEPQNSVQQWMYLIRNFTIHSTAGLRKGAKPQ